MGIYLDKLKSTLTETQTKQITNLLLKKKNTGEVRNLEEFKAELVKLTNKLLENKITPSLELFIDQFGEFIDSTSYNFMLDRIRDDLETIFAEANNLSDILINHDDLITSVVLKSIRTSIDELENKVSLYEFIAGNADGFTNAQFNTFKANANLFTARTEKDSSILFFDPRLGELITIDASVNFIGEQISLGASEVHYRTVRNIRQVFDASATQAEAIVSINTNDINKIIDNTVGTYWIYSTLQRSIKSDGITSKLEFQLSGNYDINFVDIETAAPYPMLLSEIQYIDSNQILQRMYLEDIEINGTKRIYFSRINTGTIYLVLKQLNPIEVHFEDKKSVDNLVAALMGKSVTVDVDSTEEDLKKVIASNTILQDAFNITSVSTSATVSKYYNYVIGLDNVKIGHSTYSDKSVFVSKTVIVDRLTQCGLKVKEQRPKELSGIITMTSDTYPLSYDDSFFHGSLEYWLVLQNFNANDQLIDINTVPILPFGVTRVFHERLLLTAKVNSSTIPNTGKLMFYTKHTSAADLAAISVYRNGTLLTYNTDWQIESAPFTNSTKPPNGSPNTVGIRIISPALTDFYTVSYTPLVSNTRVFPLDINALNLTDASLLKVVDLVGDASARIGINNVIYIDPRKLAGQVVEYTKVNLVVILRKNSSDTNLSPILDEYLLLTSNKDSSKFSKLTNV